MSRRSITIAAALTMLLVAPANPVLSRTPSHAPVLNSSMSWEAAIDSGGCIGTSASTRDLTVVHMAIGASLAAASQILAFDRGYFEQAGVSVERAPQISEGNVTLITAALLSGQVDAIGGPVDAGIFNAAGQGAGLKIVGTQAEQKPGASSSALVVRKALMDAGRVNTYADLKGLRIGVAGHGNATEFQVHKALDAGGLSMSDVDLTTLDFPTMTSALANNAIDAGVFPEPFVTQLVNSGDGVVWKTTSDVVPGLQTTVLMFSPRLLANRDLAVRTMMGYLCGARDFNDAFVKNINRDQAVQDLVNGTAIKDPNLYDQMSYAAVDPNGRVNLASIQDQLEWYTEMGYVNQRVDLGSLYDPSIAEAAVARLGEYH